MSAQRPPVSTLLSILALFFALGGSAYGVTKAFQPQARCANGAVRGIVAVTGSPSGGIGNIPDSFSSAGDLFSRNWSCAGPRAQVRRVGLGTYDVRFPGNTATSALVSASDAETSVTPMPGGIFRVGIHIVGGQNSTDAPFVVAVI
jgi:hypothetical protein